MSINFRPSVGQILECDYGNYPALGEDGKVPIDVDAHIPPEIVKNRLVVVLNGKINNACIVVPLSTTRDVQKTTAGMHVELGEDELPDLGRFKKCVRWAKADLIQQVSTDRLNSPRTLRGRDPVKLAHATVGKIQEAVMKSVGAGRFLNPASPAAITDGA